MPSLADTLIEGYKKILYIPDTLPLEIVFGTIVANRIREANPLWLYVLGRPGAGKSELLMSLDGIGEVTATDSITSKTLISGAVTHGGEDPSLLPKLDGRSLVIKDLTTLLNEHPNEKRAIFGILRSAYDGTLAKDFGTGKRAKYDSKFGLIAGVTHEIEREQAEDSTMGERFLRVAFEFSEEDEMKILRRAMENTGAEATHRAKLKQLASESVASLPRIIETVPTHTEPQIEQILALASTTARLRAAVRRDKFSKDVLYMPAPEVPTRIAKQLLLLGYGVSLWKGSLYLTDDAMDCIRRAAYDTVPTRTRSILNALREGGDAASTTNDIVERSRIPYRTATSMLDDMALLQIVEQREYKPEGRGRPGKAWAITKPMQRLLERSNWWTHSPLLL